MPILDLTKANEVSPEISQYKTDPHGLIKTLRHENVSLTEHLEALDPTEKDQNGQNIGKFDAFDRHLMSNSIELHGKNQFDLTQIYKDAAYLMPELVKREIEAGMNVHEKYSINDLIATTITQKGSTYQPLYIPDLDTDTAAKKKKYASSKKSDGAEFPKLEIRQREKTMTMQDYGLAINMSYRVLRDYKWEDFAIVLRLIGAQMAAFKLGDIYKLGTVGDGTVGAATNVFNGTDGTLAYKDLVHAQASFYAPFNMGAMLCDVDSFESILSLAQFTEPNSNSQFQNNGVLATPFGTKMKQVNSTAKHTVTAKEMVVLDPEYAVRQVKSQDIMVEAEKIIDQKLEECVVSEESAFSVIADGAIKQVEWHA